MIHITKAFYFIGVFQPQLQSLYQRILRADYILIFREHADSASGKKKGNVDTDIVFEVMRKIAEREQLDKILLVSGDGDYWKMVHYLIQKGRFVKLLSPSRHSTSALYKQCSDVYRDFLDAPAVKRKIQQRAPTKNAGSP